MSSSIDRLKIAIAEHYVIERELGHGAMATVYLARDLRLKREVAVKVLLADLSFALGPERFRREIDLATVKRCNYITVDSRGTARNECGDLLPAVENGLVDWDALTEIGEVIAGRAPRRTSPHQITLYESHGMGIQDLYVANTLLELSRERGVGVDLPVGV